MRNKNGKSKKLSNHNPLNSHLQQSFPFVSDQEHALARHTDPSTSHWAAAEVDVPRIEGLVADAIRRAGKRGLIAADLPWRTGLPLNTVTPRTRPLCTKGIIFDSGEKRPGPSGKLQIVWKISLTKTKENGNGN